MKYIFVFSVGFLYHTILLSNHLCSCVSCFRTFFPFSKFYCPSPSLLSYKYYIAVLNLRQTTDISILLKESLIFLTEVDIVRLSNSKVDFVSFFVSNQSLTRSIFSVKKKSGLRIFLNQITCEI